ncbi:MAG: 2Fe-2S iron-sulfur cluster-binding protein [Pirellulales bacterium]
MPLVNFVNVKKQVQVPEGTNLRNAALEAGVPVYQGLDRVFNCHGMGTCGSCCVLMNKGAENASPMSWWERMRLRMSLFFLDPAYEDRRRLACCTRVNGDMEVQTCPPMNWCGENFFS